jgi:hypothetical protein
VAILYGRARWALTKCPKRRIPARAVSPFAPDARRPFLEMDTYFAKVLGYLARSQLSLQKI